MQQNGQQFELTGVTGKISRSLEQSRDVCLELSDCSEIHGVTARLLSVASEASAKIQSD